MSKRIERVNALLKRELSQLIFKEIEFSKDVLVTITRVDALDNLNEARVYISVMPEKESAMVLQILNKKIYFLQQKINRRLKMRPVPQIRFLEEKETADAGRIEELLEQLKKGKK
jgi:ribosome-binding factor A